MSEAPRDSQWPSGRWIGNWTEPRRPQYPSTNCMTLDLQFQGGSMYGTGNDRVGNFQIHGDYNPEQMTCSFIKRYPGLHEVIYEGHRDGKGIYGAWRLSFTRGAGKGGFHIWPAGMEEKVEMHRTQEEKQPVYKGIELEVEKTKELVEL